VVTAASIETLQERLDGLVVDVRAAQQQSRSAEHAELRSIRAEHEDVSGAAARAEKGLRGVEHRRAELQTQLQQRSSELRRLERQRQQLTEELEMGETSMRHAESGVHGGWRQPRIVTAA
jgi:chromosome segregation ATPase